MAVVFARFPEQWQITWTTAARSRRRSTSRCYRAPAQYNVRRSLREANPHG